MVAVAQFQIQLEPNFRLLWSNRVQTSLESLETFWKHFFLNHFMYILFYGWDTLYLHRTEAT